MGFSLLTDVSFDLMLVQVHPDVDVNLPESRSRRGQATDRTGSTHILHLESREKLRPDT